jgi:hypothetical protein
MDGFRNLQQFSQNGNSNQNAIPLGEDVVGDVINERYDIPGTMGYRPRHQGLQSPTMNQNRPMGQIPQQSINSPPEQLQRQAQSQNELANQVIQNEPITNLHQPMQSMPIPQQNYQPTWKTPEQQNYINQQQNLPPINVNGRQIEITVLPDGTTTIIIK